MQNTTEILLESSSSSLHPLNPTTRSKTAVPITIRCFFIFLPFKSTISKITTNLFCCYFVQSVSLLCNSNNMSLSRSKSFILFFNCFISSCNSRFNVVFCFSTILPSPSNLQYHNRIFRKVIHSSLSIVKNIF